MSSRRGDPCGRPFPEARPIWAATRARPTPEEAGILADDCILEAYVEDCARFADLTRLRPDAALRSQGAVIFEGAQGLMLDQAIGTMPHVTRSHTGLANMAAIAAEAGIEEIEAIYVTRAYATRHGAGPLPGEADGIEGFEIVDETNAPNDWQGRMRYAALDLDVMAGAIGADLGLVGESGLRIRRGVAVTCLDQAGRCAPVWIGGDQIHVVRENIGSEISRRPGMPLLTESWAAMRGQLRMLGGTYAGVRGRFVLPRSLSVGVVTADHDNNAKTIPSSGYRTC